MKIIIGLGNPGERYILTRHNFGFIILDILSESWGIKINKRKYSSVYGVGTFNGTKVILVKPYTFMNNSGKAVKMWFDEYGFGFDNTLVIHDDIDLDKGTVKLKKNGGHGGHRGLKSIIDETKTTEFSRLRIGAGRPPGRERDRDAIVDWLLKPMTREEFEQMLVYFRRAKSCVEYFVSFGIEKAMGLCNRKIISEV